MPLTIEDGTGVIGADAYVDVDYVDAYAVKYGKTDWDTLTDDPSKEIKIRLATQFADSEYLNDYRPLHPTQQNLAFPAAGARIRGVAVVGIPSQLKDAIAELSIIAVKTSLIDVQASRNPTQRTVKVGDVSKSETWGADSYKKIFHPVEMILRPLLGYGSKLGAGVSQFQMVRVG